MPRLALEPTTSLSCHRRRGTCFIGWFRNRTEMEFNEHIVADGGGITRLTTGRPVARLFMFLSVIWCLMAICAPFPFWEGWPRAFSALDWLCGLLVVLEPIFIVLAIGFGLIEKPRTITWQEQSSDHDVRQLH